MTPPPFPARRRAGKRARTGQERQCAADHWSIRSFGWLSAGAARSMSFFSCTLPFPCEKFLGGGIHGPPPTRCPVHAYPGDRDKHGPRPDGNWHVKPLQWSESGGRSAASAGPYLVPHPTEPPFLRLIALPVSRQHLTTLTAVTFAFGRTHLCSPIFISTPCLLPQKLYLALSSSKLRPSNRTSLSRLHPIHLDGRNSPRKTVQCPHD